VIGALCSPLGPHSENDLLIDLYSGSTLIVIMNGDLALNDDRALSPPLGPYLESDLATDL
jgi:hypothetical protein